MDKWSLWKRRHGVKEILSRQMSAVQQERAAAGTLAPDIAPPVHPAHVLCFWRRRAERALAAREASSRSKHRVAIASGGLREARSRTSPRVALSALPCPPSTVAPTGPCRCCPRHFASCVPRRAWRVLRFHCQHPEAGYVWPSQAEFVKFAGLVLAQENPAAFW